MLHCEVIGTVWSSVKVSGLDNRNVLLVRPINHDSSGQSSGLLGTLVAIDCVDAGRGDHVVVALGHAARNAVHRGADLPIEAAIVAILDGWESEASESPSAPNSPDASRPRKKAATRKSSKKKSRKKVVRKAKKAPEPQPPIDETGELFRADLETVDAPASAEPDAGEGRVIPEEDAELPGFDDVDDIWGAAEDDDGDSEETPKDS